MTPFIRNGKLVEGALVGMDVKKMDGETAQGMLEAVKKSQNGSRLKASDVAHVVKAMESRK